MFAPDSRYATQPTITVTDARTAARAAVVSRRPRLRHRSRLPPDDRRPGASTWSPSSISTLRPASGGCATPTTPDAGARSLAARALDRHSAGERPDERRGPARRRRERRCPRGFYDAIQALEVEESSEQPGRAAAHAAGQPHFGRRPAVRRRRHVRADDERHPDRHPLGLRGIAPVRIRRLCPLLAAAPRPHLRRVADRDLGPGRVVADERRRQGRRVVRPDRGRGRQRDLRQRTGSPPPTATPTDDSPSHTPDGHTLFQRATDLQFLRGLARRGGKLCRVACTDTPGSRTGYFVLPDLSSGRRRPRSRSSTRTPGRSTASTSSGTCCVPTEVDAAGVDLTQSSSAGSDVSTDSSGLTALDQRDLATYLGQSSTLLLTAPADVPELDRRAAAVLAESGFFARCTGEADADRLGGVLRVGDVVSVAGRRGLQSGNWLVWTCATGSRSTPGGWASPWCATRWARPRPAAASARSPVRSAGRGEGRRYDRGGSRARGSARAAAHPLLRQVPRASSPTSTRRRCGSRRWCPTVLGDVETGWCMPCVPYAGPQCRLRLSARGRQRRLDRVRGRRRLLPIWVGGYWRDGEYPSDAAADVKVIVTNAPHEIKLDDDAGVDHHHRPQRQHRHPGRAPGITLANGGSRRSPVSILDACRSTTATLRGPVHRSTHSPGRADFAYPPSASIHVSQQTAQAAYAAHVDQMVRQLLLTAPGERGEPAPVRLRPARAGVRPGSDALEATVQAARHPGAQQWLDGIVDVVDVAVGARCRRSRAGRDRGDGHLHAGRDPDRPDRDGERLMTRD